MQNDLIVKLNDAYQYLKVQNAYNALIEKYRNNTQEYENNYFKLKNRNFQETSKWSLKLMMFPILFLFVIIFFAVEGILGKIFTLLCIAGMIFYFVHSSKSEKNKSNKFNNKFQKEAEDYWQNVGGPAQAKNMQTIQKIKSEKEKFETENAEVLEVVPYAYRSESTVGFLLNVIFNKRADNLKEAINLYEEELHRLRMENAINSVAQTIEDRSFEMSMQMSEISSSIDMANSRLRNIENLEFYQAFIKDN